MTSELLKRFMFAIAVVAVVTVTAYSAPVGERFFAVITSAAGLIAMLLIRPSVPLRTRLRRIGKWDVAAPVLLLLWAVATDSENLAVWIRCYIYMSVFSIGMGTGLSLLFRTHKFDTK